MTISKQEFFEVVATAAATAKPPLAESVMTRYVLVSIHVLPTGERVLNRMTSEADGRVVDNWDMDGMLWNALTEGRNPLKRMHDPS